MIENTGDCLRERERENLSVMAYSGGGTSGKRDELTRDYWRVGVTEPRSQNRKGSEEILSDNEMWR